MAQNNEEILRTLEMFLEEIQATKDLTDPAQIMKAYGNIQMTQSARKDLIDFLDGKYREARANLVTGEQISGSKYTTLSKTADQVDSIRKAMTSDNTYNNRSTLMQISKELSKYGVTLAPEYKNGAIHLTPIVKGNKNFFYDNKVKQVHFDLPIDRNGRIIFDQQEKNNILYTSADRNGKVVINDAVSVGLQDVLRMLKSTSVRQALEKGTRSGASIQEIEKMADMLDFATQKQMRAAINAGSAFSQRTAQTEQALRDELKIQGSPYREQINKSLISLQRTWDNLINHSATFNNNVSNQDFVTRNAKKQEWSDKINRMGLYIRTRGVDAGMKDILKNKDFADILNSDIGEAIVIALGKIATFGTYTQPVNEVHGLDLAYINTVDRAFSFLLPPSSRKGYQVELANFNFFTNKNKQGSSAFIKGALFTSASEEQRYKEAQAKESQLNSLKNELQRLTRTGGKQKSAATLQRISYLQQEISELSKDVIANDLVKNAAYDQTRLMTINYEDINLKDINEKRKELIKNEIIKVENNTTMSKKDKTKRLNDLRHKLSDNYDVASVYNDALLLTEDRAREIIGSRTQSVKIRNSDIAENYKKKIEAAKKSGKNYNAEEILLRSIQEVIADEKETFDKKADAIYYADDFDTFRKDNSGNVSTKVRLKRLGNIVKYIDKNGDLTSDFKTDVEKYGGDAFSSFAIKKNWLLSFDDPNARNSNGQNLRDILRASGKYVTPGGQERFTGTIIDEYFKQALLQSLFGDDWIQYKNVQGFFEQKDKYKAKNIVDIAGTLSDAVQTYKNGGTGRTTEEFFKELLNLLPKDMIDAQGNIKGKYFQLSGDKKRIQVTEDVAKKKELQKNFMAWAQAFQMVSSNANWKAYTRKPQETEEEALSRWIQENRIINVLGEDGKTLLTSGLTAKDIIAQSFEGIKNNKIASWKQPKYQTYAMQVAAFDVDPYGQAGSKSGFGSNLGYREYESIENLIDITSAAGKREVGALREYYKTLWSQKELSDEEFEQIKVANETAKKLTWNSPHATSAGTYKEVPVEDIMSAVGKMGGNQIRGKSFFSTEGRLKNGLLSIEDLKNTSFGALLTNLGVDFTNFSSQDEDVFNKEVEKVKGILSNPILLQQELSASTDPEKKFFQLVGPGDNKVSGRFAALPPMLFNISNKEQREKSLVNLGPQFISIIDFLDNYVDAVSSLNTLSGHDIAEVSQKLGRKLYDIQNRLTDSYEWNSSENSLYAQHNRAPIPHSFFGVNFSSETADDIAENYSKEQIKLQNTFYTSELTARKALEETGEERRLREAWNKEHQGEPQKLYSDILRENLKSILSFKDTDFKKIQDKIESDVRKSGDAKEQEKKLQKLYIDRIIDAITISDDKDSLFQKAKNKGALIELNRFPSIMGRDMNIARLVVSKQLRGNAIAGDELIQKIIKGDYDGDYLRATFAGMDMRNYLASDFLKAEEYFEQAKGLERTTRRTRTLAEAYLQQQNGATGSNDGTTIAQKEFERPFEETSQEEFLQKIAKPYVGKFSNLRQAFNTAFSLNGINSASNTSTAWAANFLSRLLGSPEQLVISAKKMTANGMDIGTWDTQIDELYQMMSNSENYSTFNGFKAIVKKMTDLGMFGKEDEGLVIDKDKGYQLKLDNLSPDMQRIILPYLSDIITSGDDELLKTVQKAFHLSSKFLSLDFKEESDKKLGEVSNIIDKKTGKTIFDSATKAFTNHGKTIFKNILQKAYIGEDTLDTVFTSLNDYISKDETIKTLIGNKSIRSLADIIKHKKDIVPGLGKDITARMLWGQSHGEKFTEEEKENLSAIYGATFSDDDTRIIKGEAAAKILEARDKVIDRVANAEADKAIAENYLSVDRLGRELIALKSNKNSIPAIAYGATTTRILSKIFPYIGKLPQYYDLEGLQKAIDEEGSIDALTGELTLPDDISERVKTLKSTYENFRDRGAKKGAAFQSAINAIEKGNLQHAYAQDMVQAFALANSNIEDVLSLYNIFSPERSKQGETAIRSWAQNSSDPTIQGIDYAAQRKRYVASIIDSMVNGTSYKSIFKRPASSGSQEDSGGAANFEETYKKILGAVGLTGTAQDANIRDAKYEAALLAFQMLEGAGVLPLIQEYATLSKKSPSKEKAIRDRITRFIGQTESVLVGVDQNGQVMSGRIDWSRLEKTSKRESPKTAALEKQNRIKQLLVNNGIAEQVDFKEGDSTDDKIKKILNIKNKKGFTSLIRDFEKDIKKIDDSVQKSTDQFTWTIGDIKSGSGTPSISNILQAVEYVRMGKALQSAFSQYSGSEKGIADLRSKLMEQADADLDAYISKYAAGEFDEDIKNAFKTFESTELYKIFETQGATKDAIRDVFTKAIVSQDVQGILQKGGAQYLVNPYYFTGTEDGRRILTALKNKGWGDISEADKESIIRRAEYSALQTKGSQVKAADSSIKKIGEAYLGFSGKVIEFRAENRKLQDLALEEQLASLEGDEEKTEKLRLQREKKEAQLLSEREKKYGDLRAELAKVTERGEELKDQEFNEGGAFFEPVNRIFQELSKSKLFAGKYDTYEAFRQAIATGSFTIDQDSEAEINSYLNEVVSDIGSEDDAEISVSKYGAKYIQLSKKRAEFMARQAQINEELKLLDVNNPDYGDKQEELSNLTTIIDNYTAAINLIFSRFDKDNQQVKEITEQAKIASEKITKKSGNAALNAKAANFIAAYKEDQNIKSLFTTKAQYIMQAEQIREELKGVGKKDVERRSFLEQALQDAEDLAAHQDNLIEAARVKYANDPSKLEFIEKAGRNAEYQMKESLKGAKRQKVAQGTIGGIAVSSLLGRFSGYYGISQIIQKISQAFQTLTKTAATLNSALTNLRVTTGKTSSQVTTMISNYGQLANSLGVTVTEVASSAQEWLRQGYETSEVNNLVAASMKLSKLGLMDVASATSALTSSLKGFKLQASQSSEVVDKLTAIDMEAATSAGEIANGLAQFANIGSLAGVNIDQAAAYVATISDVSQMSGASAGQALKTIISRYGNVKAGAYNKLSLDSDTTDTENAVNDVERVLSKLGISIRDGNSQFKDFDEILSQIAERWNSLDTVSQRAISTAFAGTRQQEAFLTLMQNWDKYEELLDVSENASGTSDRKYAAYQESLAATEAKLAAAIEEFVNSADWVSVVDTFKKAVTAIIEGAKTWVPILQSVIYALNGLLAMRGGGFVQDAWQTLKGSMVGKSFQTFKGFKEDKKKVGGFWNYLHTPTNQLPSLATQQQPQAQQPVTKTAAEIAKEKYEEAATKASYAAELKKKEAAESTISQIENTDKDFNKEKAKIDKAKQSGLQDALDNLEKRKENYEAHPTKKTKTPYENAIKRVEEQRRLAEDGLDDAKKDLADREKDYKDAAEQLTEANKKIGDLEKDHSDFKGTITSGDQSVLEAERDKLKLDYEATEAQEKANTTLGTFSSSMQNAANAAQNAANNLNNVPPANAAQQPQQPNANTNPNVNTNANNANNVNIPNIQTANNNSNGNNQQGNGQNGTAPGNAMVIEWIAQSAINIASSAVSPGSQDTHVAKINGQKISVESSEEAKNKAKAVEYAADIIPVFGPVIKAYIPQIIANSIDANRDKIRSMSAKSTENLEVLSSVESIIDEMRLSFNSEIEDREKLTEDLRTSLYTEDGAEMLHALRDQIKQDSDGYKTIDDILDAYVSGSESQREEAATEIKLAQLQLEATEKITANAERRMELADATKEADKKVSKIMNEIEKNEVQKLKDQEAGKIATGEVIASVVAVIAAAVTAVLTEGATLPILVGLITGGVGTAANHLIQKGTYEDMFEDYLSSKDNSSDEVRIQQLDKILDQFTSAEDYDNLSEKEKETRNELIEAIEEEKQAILDEISFRQQQNKELDKNTLSQAIIKSEINGKSLIAMTPGEANNVSTKQMMDVIAENLEGEKLYTVSLPQGGEEYSQSLLDLITPLLKEYDSTAAILQGSRTSLAEFVKKPSDQFTREQAKVFANAFYLNNIKDLKDLVDVFGTLTLDEVIKGSRELAQETDDYNNLLLSVTDSSQSVNEQITSILEKFPDLARYLGNTTELIEQIIKKEQQLNVYIAYSQADELLNDEDTFNGIWDSMKNVLTKEEQDRYRTQFSKGKEFQVWYAATMAGTNESDKEAATKLYAAWQESASKIIVKVNQDRDLWVKTQEWLEHTYEEELENLNAQKDALSDINSQREYELKLVQARIDLENAQKEKQRIYRAGIGWVYEADQSKIKDAQENLEQLEREKTISSIEEQIRIVNDNLEDLKQQDATQSLEELQKIAENFIAGDLGGHHYLNAAIIQQKKNASFAATLDSFGNPVNEDQMQTDAEKVKAAYQKVKEQAENLKSNPYDTQQYNAAVEEYNSLKNDFLDIYSGPAGEAYLKKTINDSDYYSPTKREKYEEISVFGNNIYSGQNAAQLTEEETLEQMDVEGWKYNLVVGKDGSLKDLKGGMDKSKKGDIILSVTRDGKNIKFYRNTGEKDEDGDKLFEELYIPVGSGLLSTLSEAIKAGGGKATDLQIASFGDQGNFATATNTKVAGQIFIPTAGNSSFGMLYNVVVDNDTGSPMFTWKNAQATAAFATGSGYVKATGLTESAIQELGVKEGAHTSSLKAFLLGKAGGREKGFWNDNTRHSLEDQLKTVEGQAKLANGSYDFMSHSAIINESGVEAIVTPSGTITALPSHTGVVPADITKNLWALGEIAPSLIDKLEVAIKPDTIGKSVLTTSTDESFNVNSITMNVNADGSFDADAFVRSVKQRVALTRNLKY